MLNEGSIKRLKANMQLDAKSLLLKLQDSLLLCKNQQRTNVSNLELFKNRGE